MVQNLFLWRTVTGAQDKLASNENFLRAQVLVERMVVKTLDVLKKQDLNQGTLKIVTEIQSNSNKQIIIENTARALLTRYLKQNDGSIEAGLKNLDEDIRGIHKRAEVIRLGENFGIPLYQQLLQTLKATSRAVYSFKTGDVRGWKALQARPDQPTELQGFLNDFDFSQVDDLKYFLSQERDLDNPQGSNLRLFFGEVDFKNHQTRLQETLKPVLEKLGEILPVSVTNDGKKKLEQILKMLLEKPDPTKLKGTQVAQIALTLMNIRDRLTQINNTEIPSKTLLQKTNRHFPDGLMKDLMKYPAQKVMKMISTNNATVYAELAEYLDALEDRLEMLQMDLNSQSVQLNPNQVHESVKTELELAQEAINHFMQDEKTKAAIYQTFALTVKNSFNEEIRPFVSLNQAILLQMKEIKVGGRAMEGHKYIIFSYRVDPVAAGTQSGNKHSQNKGNQIAVLVKFKQLKKYKRLDQIAITYSDVLENVTSLMDTRKIVEQIQMHQKSEETLVERMEKYEFPDDYKVDILYRRTP